MKRLFWHWAISAITLLLAAAALQKGVHITPWYHVIWLAPLLGLVNLVVGGIAGIISMVAMPVNLLTLGCFGFVVSFILYVLSIYWLGHWAKLSSFQVDNFYWAAALAIVMALVSTLLNMVLPGKKERR
ncbi:MAG: phage holin family protein [Armatimonadota bacterium]